MKKIFVIFLICVVALFNSVVIAFADEYVILNRKNNTYHKLDCKYGQMARDSERIRKPNRFSIKYKPASCCYPESVKNKQLKNPNMFVKAREKHLIKTMQENKISLYFVNPIHKKRPRNACINGVCRSLITLIDNSQQTIDIAAYGFQGQDEIINALRRAKARGVRVRGVVDDYGSKIYPDTSRIAKEFGFKTDIYIPIEQTKLVVDKERSQSALMHNKFFVIDSTWVFTGSTNITDSCMTYNSNNSVVIYSPVIANIYSQEFNQMFEQKKFHTLKDIIENKQNISLNKDTKISVYFSPQDDAINTGTIPLIEAAEKNIYVLMFYLTNRDIVDALIKAKNKGISIKIIVDSTLTREDKNQVNVLRNAGLPVKVENWNGKLHQKSLVVDNKYTEIGSTNWTKTANIVNDENMLIIENEKFAKKQIKEFKRLWGTIPKKYLQENPSLPAYAKLE